MRIGRKLGGGIVLLLILIASAVATTTFTYKEGDTVRLLPEAVDPDNPDGIITFVFSEPLNQSGEWKTTGDDAGFYNITISAFDGETYSDEVVSLIIENVNQPPEIIIDDLEIAETDLLSVNPKVVDPDNDPVTISFSPPLNENGQWQTDYGDAGRHSITITANDGDLETSRVITVTVTNSNRMPNIVEIEPVGEVQTMGEGEELTFSALAEDLDDDMLTYTWFVDNVQQAIGRLFNYNPDFDSEGSHTIRLDVTDGDDVISEKWTVDVRNTNRAPSFQGIAVSYTVHEGELFEIILPQTDIDGDVISYSVSDPVGDDFQWTPSFQDSGLYEIRIIATDGSLDSVLDITLTVIDVDQAPQFQNLEDTTVKEDELLKITFNAVDPDGDIVTYSMLDNLLDAKFEDDTLTWTPGFDFISLPKNSFGRILSRTRLSRFTHPDTKKIQIRVSACGKEACSEGKFQITVVNSNRKPIIDIKESVTLQEGERLKLKPIALDEDGEYVRFKYSSPVGYFGSWNTGFDDAGEYQINVTASDGKDSVEKIVRLTINDINRNPEFGRLVDRRVSENDTLTFRVPVSDPDGDKLTIIVENITEGATFEDGIFSWTPSFDVVRNEDKGIKSQIITFVASDKSEVSVKKSMTVSVKDTNRPPIIIALTPKEVTDAVTLQQVVFNAEAADPDGDKVTYEWKLGTFDGIKGPTAVARTFTQPGIKNIRLKVIDEKNAETQHEWFVNVGRQQVAVQPVAQPQIGGFVSFEVEG
jgi:hypothetical protein